MSVAATLDVVIGASTSQLRSGLNDADRQIGSFASRGENRIGQFASKVGAFAGGAFLTIGGLAINAAADWETAFADVRKTVDATDEELAVLEDTLRGMATSEVLGSLEGASTTLAGIAASAGALGVATEDIDEFTASVAALDVASDLTAEDAANFAARFANVTGLDIATDIDNLADTIVTLGNEMAATESEIASFGERLASLSAFGWNPEEILGYGAAMASLGLNAELGSTNLIKSVTDMTSAVANSTPQLQTWADTAGMTAEEFSALASSDPEGAFNAFLEGLSGMNIDEQLQALNSLGITSQEQQRTLLTLAEGYDTVNQGIDIATEAWEGNGAAMEEARAKAETLEGSTNRLWNSLNEIGISLGEKLVPGLADVATGFAVILNGDYETGMASISTGLMDMASGIGEIVTGQEGFDFQSTIDQWTFVWMALQTITQDILQDVNLFFLNLHVSMLEGIQTALEATNVNGMNDQLIAGMQFQIDLALSAQGDINAARAIEDQLNELLATGEPLDLTAPITFTQGDVTGTQTLGELIFSPNVVAELDPFTLQALQTQVTQQLQDAAASGNADTLMVNYEVAANLGLDPDAIISQLRADTETALTEAYASGDQAAIMALLPTAINLQIDAVAIREDAATQVEAAIDGSTMSASVNFVADIDQVTQQLEDAAASGNAEALLVNYQIALDLGLDPEAILNQLRTDTEAALTTAYNSGDQAAIMALLPTAINLQIDTAAIRADATNQVEGAIDGTSMSALVNMEVDVNATLGEISPTSGTITVTVTGNATTIDEGDGGGEAVPIHHSGGVFEAPHGQSEGLALLEDGETIRTSGQESALGRRQGRGSGNYYNVTVFGTSEYQVLEMTQRAARDAGYE